MSLEPLLTPELVREMARLAGLDLGIERAKELIPALEPVFDGDAKIAALELGTLTAAGNPWPEVDGG
jgi:hypothetical protein